MAVDREALYTSLLSFFNPEGSLPKMSENSPEGVAAHQLACATKWAEAMQAYVAAMEPDHQVAIDGTASSNLQAALNTVFVDWYDARQWTCTELNAAFDAFAAEIFASQALTTKDSNQISRKWVGKTLPPGINFCVQPTPQYTSYEDAANYFADIIHNWFIEGVSETIENDAQQGKLPHTATWDGVVSETPSE